MSAVSVAFDGGAAGAAFGDDDAGRDGPRAGGSTWRAGGGASGSTAAGGSIAGGAASASGVRAATRTGRRGTRAPFVSAAARGAAFRSELTYLRHKTPAPPAVAAHTSNN